MKKTISRVKRIAAVLLSAVVITAGMTGVSAADSKKEKVNVAKGKTVTAENTFGAGYVAKNAVDGNPSSIWSGPTEACELVIDLQQSYGIDSIAVTSRNDLAQTVAVAAVYGSNLADFTVYDELLGEFTVPERSTTTMEVEQNKKYRYVKFEFSAYPCVAEIYIYEKEITETAVEITYPDIEDVSLKNAVGLLGGFRVVIPAETESNFEAEKEVTRAQFAKLLADLTGLGNIEPGKNPFTDIAGIPEEGSIKTLYALGAIDEYAAGLFKPNLPIDTSAAAEMTVRALGYAGFAEATGNPKAVYQSKIHELRLMKNVAQNGNLTRKDAAYILANALEAEVMEIEKVTAGGSVKFTNGKTLLECKGFDYAEGVITENYMQSFNHEWEDVVKGYVVIEGEIYATAYESMMFHAGEKVRYYYNTEDDDKTIVYLHSVNKQTELVIPADYAEGISDGSVKWNNNGKSKNERFSSSARIIYNGRPLSGSKTLSSCKPAEGYIRMLDYEGDGIYDTVVIFDYTDNVLKSVNRKKGVYNFEAGKQAVTVADDITAMWYRNGRIINPSSIKVGEVLSIGASTDGKHYEIYVGGSKREGKITSYSEGESIVQDYLKTFVLSKGFNNPEDIVLGERATIYTNYEGKAVYLDEDETSKDRYGVITKAAMEGGLESDLRVQVFTTGGTLEVYNVAEKATLDGKKYSTKTELLDALIRQSANEEGKFTDCFVRYSTDVNAELIEIDTLYEGTETDGLGHIATITGYPMYGIFDGKYRMQNGTSTVFIVYDGEERPEDRYEIKDVNSRFTNRVLYENVEFYGSQADVFDVIPLVVTRKSGGYSGNVSNNSYYLLVDKVVQGLNREGEAVPVVCGMYKGQYVQMPFAAADKVPTWMSYVNFSDVLRIDTSKYNEITVSELTAEYERQLPEAEAKLYPGYSFPTSTNMGPIFDALGGAYEVRDGLLCVKALSDMNSKTHFYFFTLSGFENIYVCDIDGKEVRKGSSADITEYVGDNVNYSYICVRMNEGYHRDLVIYER